MIIRTYPLLLLLCLHLSGCSGDQTRPLTATAEIPDRPSRRQLTRNLQQGKIWVVYSARSAELKTVAERFQETSNRFSFQTIPDDQLSKEDLAQKNILALGSPSSNWVSRELSNKTPFRINEEGVHFEGKSFRDSTLMLSLPLYPSPFNSNLAVIWLSGLKDAAIARQLTQNLDQGWSPFRRSYGGYEIYQREQCVLLGFFNERSWQTDPNLQFDFSISRDALLQTVHFDILIKKSQTSESDLQSLIKTCESAATAIREFTNMTKELPRIKLLLYPSAEEKGLRLYNTEQSHIDYKNNDVHIVYNSIYRNHHHGKENELLLRHLLGQPKTAALERGLAVYFTQNWQIKGYPYWALQLFRSDNAASLSEILDNQRFQEGSELIMEPLAASFVAFLITEWGRETFLQKYVNWLPSEDEISLLEKKWHAALSNQTKSFQQANWVKDALPKLRGFNFAHEGYSIYNGYISKKAAESLGKMAELGSNAAAIIPYSYIRNPQAPAPLPISDRPGSENDESVVFSIHAAKKTGMKTILKPQIWLGGGHWPGDVMMQNEADWQAFFDYYYDWIRHYAMMAEIHEVDVLVLGTEFAKATLARETDWRHLIRRIRKLYSGKLTYASNWGEEFEKVGFWDELDYIGLDCYYPLSKNEKASYKELNANFQDILKKIESVQKKFDKPLLFTEIGFRSIPAPWINPHADANGADFYGQHQKWCYEIVMKNLAEKDWSQGLMWWKWPSYLESRGRNNTGFTPNNKPAEEVIAEYWRQPDF